MNLGRTPLEEEKEEIYPPYCIPEQLSPFSHIDSTAGLSIYLAEVAPNDRHEAYRECLINKFILSRVFLTDAALATLNTKLDQLIEIDGQMSKLSDEDRQQHRTLADRFENIRISLEKMLDQELL